MSVVETKPFLQTIAFVGNPNSGKTTLYNKLTGANQKTGNFCGVTVDWVSAECTLDAQKIQLIDLPGIYTFSQITYDENQEGNEDEQITRRFIDEKQFDVIVNVVDASNLERNLYLTLQCLELGLPTIVVLTRIDLAQKKNIHFSLFHLQKSLGCPVVAVSAKTGAGIEELKALLFAKPEAPKFHLNYPLIIESKIERLVNETTCAVSRSQALRWLEGETYSQESLLTADAEKIHEILYSQQMNLQASASHAAENSSVKDIVNDAELDIHIASARYAFIEKLMLSVIAPSSKMLNVQFIKASKITRWIDTWTCHRWLGLPCFLAVMYFLFFFAINIGGAFQDCIEQLTELLFVQGVGDLLRYVATPEWAVIFFQGVGQGVSTVLTFIPVIGAMFFALAFLESSGYMARAAIVMDRLMLFLGLPGKSFVPMIIGFGCNVPAILGARTLDHKRDRILTVMMSPFMSCGARLAIFTVFVSIFFPHNGQNVVFALYLIGILMAIFTGLLLKKTILNGPVSPLIMEMPEYTLPTFRTLTRLSYHRLKRFIVNAMRLIVPVCVVIGILSAVHIPDNNSQTQKQTVLAAIAKQVTPIFAPMGLTEENWPATVGLFTGILAKEVVIGSLNTLYAQDIEAATQIEAVHYKQELRAAIMTIPENILTLRGAFANPIAAKAPVETLDKTAHQEMQLRFGSAHSAFAYLLFVLLYFPCVSATAAMVKEVKRGWTVFSVCWTTGLAYCISVMYFQLSVWSTQPILSSIWCSVMSLVLAGTIWGIHLVGKQKEGRAVPTQIVYKNS